MRYEYAGPGPHEVTDPESGARAILRPGDVFDFGAEPEAGPWRLLPEPEPEAAESDAEPLATPSPAPAPVIPPPATTPAPAPTTGE